MSYFMWEGEKIAWSENLKGDKDKPPLILLHGAGGSMLHWPPSIRRPTASNTIALDLPGHGRSSGEGRSSVEDYVRCLHAFLEETELEVCYLAGHSMGGAIALRLALTEPEKVRGLVLMSTGAKLKVLPAVLNSFASEETKPRGIKLLNSMAYGPRARKNPKLTEAGIRLLSRNSAQTLKNDFTACDGHNTMEELPQIRCPALVLCGREDKMTPVAYSNYLVEHLPRAEIEIFEQAGHMLMLEAEEPVAAKIFRWLEVH